MTSVHLVQLEKHGIKEVVNDPLSAALPPETARRLSDQHIGLAYSRDCLGATARSNAETCRSRKLPFALADQRDREVFRQLAGQMPRTNPGAGHPFADDIRRVHDDVHGAHSIQG
jgi:hypothetical protein